mmetsp:Transcript_16408/g.50903  ORF Transcript_16408/g.50903 Transcript_16408/m.50903 type:complete len:225 (-) Transcript_16408:200-874(-)
MDVVAARELHPPDDRVLLVHDGPRPALRIVHQRKLDRVVARPLAEVAVLVRDEHVVGADAGDDRDVPREVVGRRGVDQVRPGCGLLLAAVAHRAHGDLGVRQRVVHVRHEEDLGGDVDVRQHQALLVPQPPPGELDALPLHARDGGHGTGLARDRGGEHVVGAADVVVVAIAVRGDAVHVPQLGPERRLARLLRLLHLLQRLLHLAVRLCRLRRREVAGVHVVA